MKFNNTASNLHVYRDPSPEEIEERAEAIRAKWSDKERQSRMVGFAEWEIPIISNEVENPKHLNRLRS